MSGVRTGAITIVATATIAPLAGVLDARRLHHQPRRLRRRRACSPARSWSRCWRSPFELALAGLQRLLTPRGLELAARGRRARPHRIARTANPRQVTDEGGSPQMSTTARLRALFALLAALVLALAVAACGDDDDDDSRRHRHRDELDRDRGEPRQRRRRADGRLEELHRADHPRRDLRPGARGRRLRRLHRPQPRRRVRRPEGARERRDQRLSRVHLDRADLVLRHSRPRTCPATRRQAFEEAQAEFEAEGPGRLPADAVLERERGRHADRRPPRSSGSPRSPTSRAIQDLTLYGSPECRQRIDCLVGLEEYYGLEFEELHAGRHRPALRGARQGRRRPLDPVHDRRAAVRLRRLHDPRGRPGRAARPAT